MIYENEFVHYKARKFLSGPRGLQIFDSQQPQIRPKISKYRRLWQEHGKKSIGIHGLRFVCSPKMHLGVRCFWALVLLLALSCCLAMYYNIFDRHIHQQLKTVVQTSQLPIYSIEFPAVAVCLSRNINWIRHEAAERRFLPPQPTEEMRTAFYHLLSILEVLNIREYEKLNEIVMQKNLLQKIEGISITELSKFLSFRCDEVFVQCTFDDTTYNCCKLFVAEHTERGNCLVFNSLISIESRTKKLSDEFYPWKIGKAGEGSGLSFLLRYNSSYHRNVNNTHFTVNLMIKESVQWNEAITHPLYGNTRNYVSIWPQVSEALKSTRSVKPDRRRCLFTDENTFKYGVAPGLPYGRQNCHTMCLRKKLLDLCNCTMPLFFPVAEGARECSTVDLICIFDNRDVFSYMKTAEQDSFIKDERRGIICNCVKNCYSLVYLLTLNTRKVRNINRIAPLIRADIYYGQRVMTKYATKLPYERTHLLAHFGGTLGLFIGASLLSLVELLFVFLKLLALVMQDRFIIWRGIRERILKLRLK